METWKPVSTPGFEHLYEVSDAGLYRRREAERIMHGNRARRGSVSKEGYRRAILSNGAFKKYVDVHRLVALAFIPNPEGKPEVNHIDTNKKNNVVSNLEWATQEENRAHAMRMGLIKASLNPEQVRNIRAEYARGRTTYAKLGARYGVSHVTILNVVNRLNYYGAGQRVGRLGKPKIAPEQAAEIRAAYKRGWGDSKRLAALYFVSVGTLLKVVHQRGTYAPRPEPAQRAA